MTTRKINSLTLTAFFFMVSAFWIADAHALSRIGIFGGRQSTDITVESFKWQSGGIGRKAVFSEVTLRNNSNLDYSSVTLRARLLVSGKSRGGVRGKLNTALKAWEMKTFKNVRLGRMNFNADSVSLEVVGATLASEDGKRRNPLKITDWEWKSGGQQMGSGTIEKIVIKNPSNTPYGKVRILIVQKRAGKRLQAYPVTINKIARPGTETVYENVNPGFIHPSADEIEVSIVSAYPVSEKQIALMSERAGEKNTKAVKFGGKAKAVPGYDIVVREFEWGSGVAGSLGVVKSLVLTNRSAVRYAEVSMAVEFLSRKGTVVNTKVFKIKKPPTPGETVTFKNLKLGILNYSPEKRLMRIYVKGGKNTDLEQ